METYAQATKVGTVLKVKCCAYCLCGCWTDFDFCQFYDGFRGDLCQLGFLKGLCQLGHMRSRVWLRLICIQQVAGFLLSAISKAFKNIATNSFYNRPYHGFRRHFDE